MATKIMLYYGTSRLNHAKYETLINEAQVETHFHAEPWDCGADDLYPAGWYVSHPTGGCLGSGYSLTNVDGPYDSEKEAYDHAIACVVRNGWKLAHMEAEGIAIAEAAQRMRAKRQRKKLTRGSAITLLIKADILQRGWTFSDRVWRKSTTKQRVQAALSGDKSAADCLRRDAMKREA